MQLCCVTKLAVELFCQVLVVEAEMRHKIHFPISASAYIWSQRDLGKCAKTENKHMRLLMGKPGT